MQILIKVSQFFNVMWTEMCYDERDLMCFCSVTILKRMGVPFHCILI